MAVGWPVSGRAMRGGGGRPIRHAHLLLRHDGWRRLEDTGRWRDLEQRLGRFPGDGLGRRARGRCVRPECALCRHGGNDDPRQCRARRRCLCLAGRRRDLGALRPRRHPAHRQGPYPPPEPRPRLCRGLWARLWAEPAARCLSLERRRRDVGTHPLSQHAGGRDRPRDGPEQPSHSLRRLLGGEPDALQPDQWRAGQQPLQID